MVGVYIHEILPVLSFYTLTVGQLENSRCTHMICCKSFAFETIKTERNAKAKQPITARVSMIKILQWKVLDNCTSVNTNQKYLQFQQQKKAEESRYKHVQVGVRDCFRGCGCLQFLVKLASKGLTRARWLGVNIRLPDWGKRCDYVHIFSSQATFKR